MDEWSFSQAHHRVVRLFSWRSRAAGLAIGGFLGLFLPIVTARGAEPVDSAGLHLFDATRPSMGIWRLLKIGTEERKELPESIRSQVEEAIREAGRIPEIAEEYSLDLDRDGRAEIWVYRNEKGEVATVELESNQNGLRNLRIKIENSEIVSSITDSTWFHDPPIQALEKDRVLQEEVSQALANLFECKVRIPESDGETGAVEFYYEELCRQLSAEPREIISRLPVKSFQGGDEDIRDLEFYLHFADRVLPALDLLHRRKLAGAKNYAESLLGEVDIPTRIENFVIGDSGGDELIVGFGRKGIEWIEFREKLIRPGQEIPARLGSPSELAVRVPPLADGTPLIEYGNRDRQEGALLAKCIYSEGGKIMRVNVEGGHDFLRIFGEWVMLRNEGPELIFNDFLVPGFEAFRDGQWYLCLARFFSGVRLAAVADHQVNLSGNFSIHNVSGKWRRFEETGYSPGGLLAFGRGLEIMELQGGLGVVPDLMLGGLFITGNKFLERGHLADARWTFERMEKTAEALGEGDRQSTALKMFSYVCSLEGNYDLAIEAMLRSLDAESSFAFAAAKIRHLERMLGPRYGNEDRLAEEAILNHQVLVDRACKLGTIAILYSHLQRREESEAYFEEAGRLFEKITHRPGLADVQCGRAVWDLRDGETASAVERLNRAWELLDFTTSGLEVPRDSSGQARPEEFAIFTLEPHPRYRKELTMVSLDTKRPAYRAFVASLLGEAHKQRALELRLAKRPVDEKAEWEQADDWLRQSQRRYVGSGRKFAALKVGLRLVELKLAQEGHESAEEIFSGLRQEIADSGDAEIGWQSEYLKGLIAGKKGDLTEAETCLEKAATQVESLRGRLQSEKSKESWLASKIGIYRELVDLYLSQGEEEKVWGAAERMKARALLDVISGQGIELKGEDVARVARDEPLLFRVLQGKTKPRNWKELETVYLDHLSKGAARQEQNDFLSLYHTQPVPLEHLKSVLDSNQAVIDFVMGGDGLFAVIVSRDDIQTIAFPAWDLEKITDEVTSLRLRLENLDDGVFEKLEFFYRELLRPCLDEVKGRRHLIIVPTGSLFYVPFHALLDEDGKFVAEETQVSYAPSSSTLVMALEQSRKLDESSDDPGEFLVVAQSKAINGFPGLPAAKIEGELIVKYLGKRCRLVENVKEDELRKNLAGISGFHFAGHADLRPEDPLSSALICHDEIDNDGRFEIRELFGIAPGKGSRLAVLSACETQVGPVSQGDEIVSLSRSFLRAGIPAVIASQWRVSDEATRVFMEAFYRSYGADPGNLLEAIHQAQLHVLRGYDPAKPLESSRSGSGRGKPVGKIPGGGSTEKLHPYYWAGFSLIGAWR